VANFLGQDVWVKFVAPIGILGVEISLLYLSASFAAKRACDQASVGSGTSIGTMAVPSGAVQRVSLWSSILTGYCATA